MALPGDTKYDCIVIGAGIQGSFTAYHLAKLRKKTLLLEQFPLPHSRGSSHGQTRIIRRAYEEHFYTHMMEECYQLWTELEKESGAQLFRKTGLLVLAKAGNEEYEKVCKNMLENQIPWESLSPAEMKLRYPGLFLSPGEVACCDINGGVLFAEKALRALQMLFKQMGGIIRDGEKVMHIKPGPVVTVTTTSSIYQADGLVITAGPWAQKVLRPLGLQLPLKTLRINVCYWREKIPGKSGILQSLPCFLGFNLNGEEHEVYGLPSQEYPGLIKICFHGGNEADPEERDLKAQNPNIQDIEKLSSFISRYIPGLHPKPAVVEQCMYTNTPDTNFILDHHPLHKNIVIGAGFSGHGFKLSPVVGKILSELCIGEKQSYDLKPFRISRFKTPLKAAL
ncbi:pipecolic acid oxidase L homeolog [Xenopus laevis]|uniref:Peroxisomal sarcosine oxidase n=1 Tax=Xenopus laevis TaxID=8355 RepID=Q3KPZ3_XENLA|nr:pipecolic acid oxidase L homeolog [Xenopus laevis]AAI06467.1 MGC131181 protein [Xenopus laevis]